MSRDSGLIFMVVALAVGLVGCASHPSDRRLIAEFHQNESKFERLAQVVDKDTASGVCPSEFAMFPDPRQAQNIPIKIAAGYRALMDGFCPKCNLFRSIDGNLKLLVSTEGFLKGSYKGTPTVPSNRQT